ncbi:MULTISPECIES: amylo-alpha-1,6-glucosidase [Methanosarcina]|uniref:Glycogen debranching protein n=3 Tax=Methanosarcina barkeri TaxID=2208 RepID=A0A0G3CGA0_METBA|nr:MULTISPECIES: amylo-alpha-1,6-glucosidase [Methanosarcina]AKB53872.1 Putative glycogen debranching enzyme, archaeal type, TIGR01561 [Methanosarcina barkeri MS]AKB58037.1 Putative glycogen debranching enzyme, archaeal type, TIGR01561 [Methanosarcina barkeri 227]AKJ39750.1 glycogen debranching protein [Methanosarcina barkeri CM1]OED05372.1 glycogen debranching protein [Methanosarcina sp. A14]
MSGIRFGVDSFSTYEEGIKKEWIVGNGLGGYASSTVIGAGTRTYHGLLVAVPENSQGRFVLLSSLDEEISINKEVYRLSTHKYPDTVFPSGFSYLSKFILVPFPLWVYQPGDFTIKKKVFMIHNSNTTCILYDIRSRREGALLRISPLVNSRNFHHTVRSGELSFTQKANPSGVKLESSNGFTFLLSSNLQYHSDPKWYYNFEYDTEKQRGLNFQEDNFNPGYFESKLKLGTSHFFIAASTEDISSLTLEQVEEFYTRETYRQNLLAFNSRLTEPFALKLLRATDPFIVKNPSSGESTVIAGYHWFSDWGRDTMISMPGLLLIPRRFEEAKFILKNFSKNCNKGLIPNAFLALGGEPIYNTVDASLWFIHTVGRYFAYTKDFLFLSDVWDTVESIIENYRKGTDFGIGMDSDYLIRQGPQLTWMDAKIGEKAVTPRAGKACEINALWYNALKTASNLGTQLGKNISSYETLAAGVASNFESVFWNPETNCLFDLVSKDKAGNEVKDPAIRPNQIFAVALPYTSLSPKKEKAIVDRVEKDLLTPFGLRTLSSDHPVYKGRYQGDAAARDAAYHNGTVWPWLLGAYVKAYRKVHNYSKESLEDMRALLMGFDTHLETAGIGTISEVFDGDYPYTPGGCIAQAWSVAEILRAYVEDVLGIKP